MSNSNQNANAIASFLGQNPNADLRTFNFFDKNAVNSISWGSLDNGQISDRLDRLKACQRLLRLGVDAQEAMALSESDRKLDSALAIASLSETAFVEAANFSNPEKAKTVHRHAREKTAGLMVFLANAIQFSSPRQATALFDSAQSIRNSLGDIPSYPELFGSLDYLQCEPCQSIFSPSAYFVDLMRMVEEYIVETDDNLSLKGRRPDLENILLTCDNTNDTVPYTQIVSEVLEEKLKQELGVDDVFKHLATALYPRNLPFNLYLEQMRIYISNLESNLADIYQTFHPQEPDSTPWAREYLGLSPEDYELITTPKTDDLAQRYGVEGEQGNDFWGLKKKETFLKQTKLSWQELDDLLYQNLSSAEIESSVAHQFFINQHFSDNNYLNLNDNDEIENLNLTALDRIDRFLRLAAKLDWSFADLDWVLTSISSDGNKEINETAIQKIAQIKRLEVQTKLPLDVLCSFWHDMKTIGKGDKPERPQDLFNRIFNNPFTFQGQEVFPPAEPWTIDGTDDRNSLLRKRLLAALKLKDKDFNVLVREIFPTEETITLNLANLSGLFRNAQVLNLLGLKGEEYELVLKFLNISLGSLEQLESRWPMDEGSGTTINDKAGSNNGTLHGEANWEEVTDFPQAATRNVLQFNGSDNFIDLSQEQYFGSKYTFSAWFKTSSASSQTIFAAIHTKFNGHYLLVELQSDGKLRYLHRVPPGDQGGQDIYSEKSYADGEWHHFVAVKDPRQMKLYVDAERVGTKEENKSISANTEIVIGKIDADRDERFFNGQIAAVRNWSIAPVAYQFDIQELIAIADLAQWLKVSGFTVYELDYILNGIESASVKVVLPEKNLESLMKDLWKNVQLPEGDLNDDQRNELNEAIASHYGIEPGLFSILAQLGAESVGADDYLKLLLTEVEIGGNEWNQIEGCLKYISQMYLLVFKLPLTDPELTSITNHPPAYNIESLTKLKVQEVQTLYRFKRQLVGSFDEPDNGLIDYLEDPSIPGLAELTGWNQQQIQQVIDYLNPSEEESSGEEEFYDSVEGLLKLKGCFDLSFLLGCRVHLLCNWCDLLKDGAASEDWETYKNQANSIVNLTQAKYGYEEWTEVFGKLNGAVTERQSQILSEFALWKLEMANLRQLSEYLLLDVEMTSCACNSRIQLAILSVQTYLQRCQMGIEPGVSEVTIPPVWWEWIMNYRLWEANRKVFLYPENYIDPSLRRDASPIFKELQDELLQSEITAATVEVAYRNYFDKLAELAKLQIVDSGRFLVQTPKSPEPIETLFILAKTLTQPQTFYYRTCERPSDNKPLWGHWQKIDLQINSDYLAPVYGFNRLFVFWVETKEIEKPQENDVSKTDKITQATIKYSFQNVGQKWVAPQDLVTDVDISGKVDDSSLGKDFWQQVYPIVVPEPSLQSGLITSVIGGLQSVLATDFNAKQDSFFEERKNNIKDSNSEFKVTIASDLLPASTNFLERYNGPKLFSTANDLAATTVGNLVIFAGGSNDDNENTDIVDVFEYQNGTLVRKEHNLKLSEKRDGSAATTVGNFAIFAGGFYKNILSDTVDVFEYKDGTLVRKELNLKLSEERTLLVATTVGNLAIFAGGNTLQTSNASDAVDVFEYKDGTLVEKPLDLKLSQRRYDLAATTVGSLAIFAAGEYGGFDPSYSDAVDVFEYRNGNLVEKQGHNLTLSVARRSLAATTVGNLAIFAGGYDGNSDVDTVDVFEYQNGTLVKHEHNLELSVARSSLAATTVGNLAIFAGGRSDGGSYVDTVDVFEYQNGTLVKKDIDLTLSEKGNLLAATTVGNLAIFAGGINYDGYSDAVDVFSIPSPSFSLLPSSPELPTNTTVTPIKNQSDAFTLHNRSEAFSALSEADKLSPVARLTTSAIRHFNHTLFAEGLDGLLSLESQRISEESNFPPEFNKNLNLDFDGAYGAYFWEIFFHIPFLIASTLNANQRYNEARKWYQYIFDPTTPPPDHTEGLVGYWPMNEGSGSDIFDQKGDNHGTIKGTVEWKTVNDFPGASSRNVLEFDGNGNNYVEINNPFKNSKSFTIALWVKPSIPENNRGYKGFIGQQDGPDESRMPSLWMIRKANNNLALHGDSYDSDKNRFDFLLQDFYTSSMNGWVHITWVKDGNQYRVYRNGKLFGMPEAPLELGNVDDPDSKYWIGRARDPWYGEIAEVGIWDRALSDREIADFSDRFWQFLPFRGNTLEDLKEILTNQAAIEAYEENPFDPHAIARLRIGAYEKAVVMRYIDNLLDWADSLFTQDTWESITQATTLYLLAHDLLGPKPENVGQVRTPKPASFAEIREKYPDGIPEFLIDLENYLDDNLLSNFGNNVPFNAIDAYFCVSENPELAQYWERVEDRLFKIRHCQNIRGVERQLALFAPPIDPNQLVRLAAAGDGSLNLATTDTVPHYRFSHLLERAKAMTSTVMQLGSTLLSTLEKKDAEELAVLRATQEPILLQLITKTKEKQIEEAQANLTALQQSLTSAQGRGQHYQDLITAGWNGGEQATVTLMGDALVPQVAATAIRGAAIAGYLLPNIFGFAGGGMEFGEAINMGAATLDSVAGILTHSASIASTIAQFQRREEDWQFQQQMAEWDTEQIQAQIEVAKVRIELAQADLEVHQQSIAHSQEVEQFLKDKFTNKDLYQWMLGRLSGLYFQTYKIALEMAYSAQKAYQYELNQDDIYIEPIHWDGNKKGLLAGESLMLELNQLEKAYLDENERRLEIEKIVSLRQFDPQAFLDLKTTGECQFSFDEKLFALDFPSHYCRQIKTIELSIPAVVGPYQNINATLSQEGDKVLIKPDTNAVKWLLTLEGNEPDTGTLRQDWRQNQQIAISKGVNDSGMFVLNFQDERYLPFEGTGAISDWILKMPKANNSFDFESITDVIITLRYTAMPEGGSTIFDTVAETLKNFTGQVVLNLKQQLLQSPNHNELSFVVSPNLFRGNLKNYSISASTGERSSIYLQLHLSDSGNTVEPLPTLNLTIADNEPISLKLNKDENGIVSAKPEEAHSEIDDIFTQPWLLSDQGQNGFLSPENITNIGLLVAYEGEIDW
ncbi:LamG-like jellyroll fold domain-containing protein [Moorena producens]|uniref:Tc toxin subunit A-related protein n=1 Tax=Moorena producens TaxID=1155739 RepID=UPI003C70737E